MDPFELNTKSDRELLIIAVTAYMRLEKDLYGNGQRGKLSEIFRRIRSLEMRWWMFMGAGAVLGTTAYAELLLRRH